MCDLVSKVGRQDAEGIFFFSVDFSSKRLLSVINRDLPQSRKTQVKIHGAVT